jgi:nucleoid DNA-binding protein
MIKLDIISEVVTKTGITKTKAEAAVETVFEGMKKALAQGDRIELRGFGVFTVRPRKTVARPDINPSLAASYPHPEPAALVCCRPTC